MLMFTLNNCLINPLVELISFEFIWMWKGLSSLFQIESYVLELAIESKDILRHNKKKVDYLVQFIFCIFLWMFDLFMHCLYKYLVKLNTLYMV